MRNYYLFLQPQWTYTNANVDKVFMYFSFKDEDYSRYIDRKLLGWEQVWANIMGGNIHMVKDLKNAFEYYLRLTL